MPNRQSEQQAKLALLMHDPDFQDEIQRLHEVTVKGRWLAVGVCWLTVVPCSIWILRYNIALVRDYFTWAAVRYGLAEHPFAAFGLVLTLGMTTGLLVWQSRNIIAGFPKRYKIQLAEQVIRIRHKGRKHPLWKFVKRDRFE